MMILGSGTVSYARFPAIRLVDERPLSSVSSLKLSETAAKTILEPLLISLVTVSVFVVCVCLSLYF